MTSISSKKRTLSWPAIKWVGIISLFFASCDAPKEIGADLFSVEVGLNFTDTLRVNSSTVLMDSTQTGASNTLLVGSFFHPVLGTFESTAYTQIANADSLLAKSGSIVDSLKMHLVYRNFQGDTNQIHTLNVFKLKDSLSLSKDYFANSSVSHHPVSVGSVSFRPRPIRSRASNGDSLRLDTLQFHLSRALANELIAKFTDKAQSAGGNAFRASFPGLMFKSSTTANSALLGFSPTYSRMSLHWRNPNDPTRYVLNYYFSLSSPLIAEVQARFNQFTFSRSGALASLVKSGNSVPASLTGQVSYVQSGSGLVTKLDFPTLLKLKGNRNIAINKAELVLEMADNVDVNQSLSQLTLLQVDANNRPLRNLFGLGYVRSEGGSGIQTANYNSNQKTFTFNITTELQSIINGRKNNLGFLVTPTLLASQTGFTKMVSESARFAALNARKTRLRIYYSYIAN